MAKQTTTDTTATGNDVAPAKIGRKLGGTEKSWCKAVPGGTGITVSVLLFSKPRDFPLLNNALQKLQNAHPILSSKLRRDPATGSYSYSTPSTPRLQIQSFDKSSTAEILQRLAHTNATSAVTDSHLILEHELNRNTWQTPPDDAVSGHDVFFASVYAMPDGKLAVALRLHTAACDSTTSWTLRRQLMELIGEEKEIKKELESELKIGPTMEECIHADKICKPFWARGIDMLGYSVNSLRMSNLSFEDTKSPRRSQVARLQLDKEDTARILNGCKVRGIKLCGLLSAASLIAAHSSKGLSNDKWEKYSMVTIIECRSSLDPTVSNNCAGFYCSGVLSTHDINGKEKLWELAERAYTSFANAKNKNKHFTDMADLNFLMIKAIENPGLTPSSSLRTSLITLFEDPLIDDFGAAGVEDCISCSSIHGVGPCIAMFNGIRGGKLDCACVYPSPLYSRKRTMELIDDMKRMLLEAE